MRNALLRHILIYAMLMAMMPCLPAMAQGSAAHISLDDISNHHVNAIAEGAEGYLWIGTREGLVRYSGSGLRTYHHSDDDPYSLPGDIVTALYTDSTGVLWVITNLGNCSICDNKVRRWDNMALGYFRAITDWDEHSLLVSNHLGLATFDKETGEVRQQASHNDLKIAWRLIKTKAGNICAVKEDRNEIMMLSESFEYLGRLTMPSGVQVTGLEPSRDGNIYVSTTNGLLLMSGETFEQMKLPSQLASLTEAKDIAYICSHNHRLGIGVKGSGSYIYDEETGECTLVDAEDLLNHKNQFNAILTPQDIWLSGDNDLPRKIPIEKVNNVIDLPPLMYDEYVYDLIPEHGDNFFLKTSYRILYVDHESKVCSDVTPNDLGGKKPDRNVIYDSIRNRIAFTTDFKTIRVYDWTGSELTRPRAFPVGEFSCMWDDSEGNLYALHHQELTILSLTGQRTRQLISEDLGIVVAYRTRSGITYFLDDTFTRLYTYDRTKGFTLFKKDIGGVLYVTQTYQGKVCISTYTNGMFCLDENGNEVAHFSADNGLPSNTVSFTEEDDVGNLWICTQSNVIRISATDHSLTYFEPYNNTSDVFSLSSSIAVTNNGKIYFGGTNSLIETIPSASLPGNHIPIGLDAVLVDGREINLSRPALELDHDDNNLDFYYSALSFDTHSQLNYSYMLEGYDKDFIQAGPATVCHYTKLWPGSYTFRVRVKTPAGEWSENELVQPLVIHYNAWMTPALFNVYVGVVLLLLTFSILFVVKRRRQRRKLIARLQTMEEEKAAALKVKSEELRVKNEESPSETKNLELRTKSEEDSEVKSEELKVKNEEELEEDYEEEEPATPPAAMTERDRRLLEKIYALMDEQLSNETFNINNLAKDLGMSRSNFYNKVKALTGQSPHSLLNSYRLEKAKELLQSHEYNVNEVCYRVGFASRSGFSRSFKNKFGMAPSEV